MNILNFHDFHDSLNTSMKYVYLYLSFYQGRIQLDFDTLDAVSVLPKKTKICWNLKFSVPQPPPLPDQGGGFRVTLKRVILDTSDICIYMYA